MPAANRQNNKLIAIIASTVAAGLPLWTSSARQVNFLDYSFLLTWIVLGFIAAFFVLFFIRLNSRELIGSFTAGYIMAVIVYFVGLILLKNIIHNQFLTSLMLAIFSGMITGWTGSLAWKWIKRKKAK